MRKAVTNVLVLRHLIQEREIEDLVGIGWHRDETFDSNTGTLKIERLMCVLGSLEWL